MEAATRIVIKLAHWVDRVDVEAGGTLAAVAEGGHTETELLELAARIGGPGGAARSAAALHRLGRRAVVVRVLEVGGDPLATLASTSRRFTFAPPPQHLDRPLVLSRFAYLRALDGELVLESPRAHARLTIHDPRALAVVHGVRAPATAASVATACALPDAAVTALLGLLRGHALAIDVEPGGVNPEDDGALRTWEFHDLLFHASSRPGRHGRAVGATWRFAADEPAAPPALPAARGGTPIFLPRGDRRDVAEPLGAVLDHRRSVRSYAGDPIRRDELGRFLHHVGAVVHADRQQVSTPYGDVRLDVAARRFPSAGALYELELWPVVQRCDDLDAGLFSYDARAHALRPVAARDAAVRELLSGAAAGAGMAVDDVQVLIVVSARFARIAWKYSAMAYSAILKHVGVVVQTMYLVATSMGLAPCALGAGDSDLFALAAGTDDVAETSVGELLLGARPDPHRPELQLPSSQHERPSVPPRR